MNKKIIKLKTDIDFDFSVITDNYDNSMCNMRTQCTYNTYKLCTYIT